MVITNFHEVSYDTVWWSRTVNEEKIVMGDLFLSKVFLVVFFFVKSYYASDIKLVKDFYVLIRVMTISLVGVSFLNWSHECHKLSWDDPVEVTVLNSLIVLILLHVERAEVIPTESDCILETL